MIHLKEKVYNQEYSTQQGFHSDLMEKSSFRDKQKLTVQHHQNSFTTNAKETSLGKKKKKKKKATNRNSKIMK